MSITDKSLYEHIDALDGKEYSALELTEAYLSEIKKKNEEIGAFLYFDEELSLSLARAADKRLSEGAHSPLCGIPFAVKDNICTRGMPTTAASKILSGFIPPYDATVIELLKGDGAVILGKTNMDEFAMGSTTEGSAFRITRNPIDTSLTPGGSSGGSAAAVSAGMAPFALGSDTGGSVRQPAAFCGCVGLCPTYGAVSRFGLIAFASSLDRIGPITKTCRDNAIVFSSISKGDSFDATLKGSDFLKKSIKADIRGLKIGIAEELFSDSIDPEVKNAVLGAIEKLKSLGCTTVNVSLPSSKYAAPAYYIISSAEASSNLARYDGIRFGNKTKADCKAIEEMYKKTRSEGFGKEVKRRIMLGTFVLSEDSYESYYKNACNVRSALREDFRNAFLDCDIIVSPAAPRTAYPLGSESDSVSLYMEDCLSAPASLAGLPSLSVPCGRSKKGLPIGMQITGPAFSEDLLFSAGIAFEEI